MKRKPPVKWNEALIQNALFCYCASFQHEIIIPNSMVFGYESDLISVTKAGLIHEFEIKCTRADYKADAKKGKMRFFELAAGRGSGPNYFHYVTPPGLTGDLERPSFAGLIEAEYCPPEATRYMHTVSVISEAPRLHRNKISDWQKWQLARAAVDRFWKARFKLTATPDPAIMDPGGKL